MFKVEYFVQRDGIGLPLFTELPRRLAFSETALTPALRGNWVGYWGH